ncbi:SDR family NAD(P)-dependent oxidoreductase [Nocardia carnea]|uniref:SDR family NAD(P)-dependent oxidoreductase n=1 Tax=Nocardia carnea TaxID=37328 RepID=UPI002453EC30|nr:SDR family NAD(P)-dependent oxidoreductase [Nocardia carnea]
MARTIVISGGTDGMGRAFALERLARGDRIVAIGSNPAKGDALLAAAGSGAGRVRFLRADLSSVAETRRIVTEIESAYETVDALLLFANRTSPKRIQTAEGFERTFALYYLSRYLLSYGLVPLLERSAQPVIVNIAGVGTRKGAVNWDDPQLLRGYSVVRAQLQAGRANDLLGVSFAARFAGQIGYVLYHPGFTRSGDLTPLNPLARTAIRTLAALAARPVSTAIRPIHDFVDVPSAVPLRAIDRGRALDLSLPTLDPGAADRLDRLTGELLAARA